MYLPKIITSKTMHKLAVIFIILFPLLSASGSYSFSKKDPSLYQEEQSSQLVPITKATEYHWDIFANMLYWHAGEVGTIPNSTISEKFDRGLVLKLNLNNLRFGWDFGWRAGGRYHRVGDNQWGFSLFYTWFQSEAKNKGSYDGFVGIPSGFPLTGEINDADFLNLIWLYAAQKYHARWVLNYNVLDFEVDHQYQISQNISLRPYLGLKCSRVNQDIDICSVYHDIFANNMPVIANEKLKAHFWGLGPTLGVDSKGCLGKAGNHLFSIFNDLSGAFLWSIWRNSDHLKIDDTIIGTLKSMNRKSGSLILQNLLGFEWSVKLNEGRALLSLRVGFESQFWFDNLQVFNSYNGRQHNALTLQGGTFDLLFSF